MERMLFMSGLKTRMYGLERSLAGALTCFLALALSSCVRDDMGAVEIRERIVFSIVNDNPATKALGSSPAAEFAVSNWAVLVYEDGGLVACGTSSSDEVIEMTLPTGSYTLRAVANYPVSGADAFVPGSYVTLSSLNDYEAAYSSNSLDSFILYGEGVLNVLAGGTAPVEMHVGRLLARVQINCIEAGFDNEMAYERTVKLTGIGVSNVYGSCPLVSDLAFSSLSNQKSAWINPAGDFAVSYTGMLYNDIDATFDEEGDRFDIPHVFYVYPNPTTEGNDSRSTETWCARRTRVVVCGMIGNTARYWSLTLPGPVKRNTLYLIEKAVLKGNGSLDPESGEEAEIEYEMGDIVIDIDGDDYNVSENS